METRRHFSEEDIIAQARDVLGIIPEWYQENKRLIEKTRLEIEEENVKFSKELQLKLKHLNDIRLKTTLAQKYRPYQ